MQEVWFFSRSRQELWHKGATSGNKLLVRSMWVDCENNSILVKAHSTGPTCHTGHKTCFYRELDKADEA
jgi:phosphoribosyl-ATP pyrophosphohydrolase/phosphoribosyl-AMP cyclohydrolase